MFSTLYCALLGRLLNLSGFGPFILKGDMLTATKWVVGVY